MATSSAQEEDDHTPSRWLSTSPVPPQASAAPCRHPDRTIRQAWVAGEGCGERYLYRHQPLHVGDDGVMMTGAVVVVTAILFVVGCDGDGGGEETASTTASATSVPRTIATEPFISTTTRPVPP